MLSECLEQLRDDLRSLAARGMHMTPEAMAVIAGVLDEFRQSAEELEKRIPVGRLGRPMLEVIEGGRHD
jgi:hypothetical protein